VTLEPKAKDDAKNFGGDDKAVTACPFCGSMSGVTSEEDPDLMEDEDEDEG
jgi:hypothetical protein